MYDEDNNNRLQQQSHGSCHGPIIWEGEGGWRKGEKKNEEKVRRKKRVAIEMGKNTVPLSTSFFKNRFLLVKLMLICSS